MVFHNQSSSLRIRKKAGKLGASFVLVTHGDCVAGCLALASSRKEMAAPVVSKASR